MIKRIKKPFLVFFELSLVLFLMAPDISQAFDFQEITREDIEKILSLPQEDTYNVILSLNQELVDKATSLSTQINREPEKEAVIVLVRRAVRQTMLRYLMIDAPIDVTFKIAKEAVKMAAMLHGLQSLKDVLKTIEKLTVKAAGSYALKKLLKEEIRINAGALQVSYTDYKGKLAKHIFQYVIVYQPLTPTQGLMGVEIFSPKPLIPPENKGWLSSGTPWDLQTWKEQGKEFIPPFILTIKGQVEKTSINYYTWQDTPDIQIEFPTDVPDLGFQPQSFWQRHLWQPLIHKVNSTKVVLIKTKEKYLKKVEQISQDLSDLLTESQKTVKNLATKAVERVGDLFTKRKEGARISPSKINLLLDNQQPKDILKPKETSLLAPETPSSFQPPPGEPFFDNLPEKTTLTFNRQALVPKHQPASLRELKEKIDTLQEQTTTLLEKLKAQNKKPTTKENKEVSTDKEVEKKKEENPETTLEKKKAPEQTLCSLTSFPSLKRPPRVIFNEIAWMGSQNSFNDEWIELKNFSERTVNLKGWQVLNQKKSIKIVFDDLELRPHQLLLLERSDDNSVVEVKADLIYKGALANRDEVLYLFNQNCQLEDQVKAEPNWPAGSNQTKQTMERTPELGWQTSRSPGGTPKQPNSLGSKTTSSPKSSSNPPLITSVTLPEPPLCSQSDGPSPTLSPVIINEVAWMGDSTSSSHEWIELKNLTSQPVSLDHWQLLDRKKQIKIIFQEEDIVPPEGFFLLERSEESLPHIKADKLYNGSLNNSNETLRLFNQDCQLIDEIKALPQWPAGDNKSKRTMERDLDLKSWHTFSGSQDQGIWGTPKKENSLPDSQPPWAKARGEKTVTVNQPVNLDASQSTDNVAITSWQWDIDSSDGLNWQDPDLTGQTPTLVSGYPKPGTYTITLRVMDAQGNVASDTLEVLVEPPPQILISEVQIGTDRDAKDEFVELYNQSEREVDLSGFSLKKKTGSGRESLLVSSEAFSGKIGPKEYFLIAHPTHYQDEINPDLYYSGETYSLGPDTTVFLYDQYQNLLDKIGFGSAPDFQGSSPAPNPLPPYSLGRKYLKEKELYQQTNNNHQDFELQIPTPKAQNQGLVQNSSSTSQTLQTLLITEIQIGTQTSSDHDFIEIYNPSDRDVDISDWQLKKRSSTGREYSVRKFPQNTIIPKRSYFLWANSSYAHPELMLPDATSTQTLAKNNSVALFDDKGNIVDEVAWGSSDNPFREGQSFPENPPQKASPALSLQRKQDPETKNYQDTNNNVLDFEIATSTPTNSQGQKGDVFAPLISDDLRATVSDNQVILSWSPGFDPDTTSSQITYRISFEKQGGAPHQDNLIAQGTTTLTVKDLYYDSTYTFQLQASDGLYFSPTSSSLKVSLAPETPQWQMTQLNKEHNYRSPWSGSFNPNNFCHASPWREGSGWGLPYSERFIRGGPVIDQNGTVYIANFHYLSALQINDCSLKAKWLYQIPEDRSPNNNLIIGSDGTVYLFVQDDPNLPPNQVLAVSPFGVLKWKRDCLSDCSRVNIGSDNLYLSLSYPLNATASHPLVLALSPHDGSITWAFDVPSEQAFQDPFQIPIITSTSTSPSTVVIDQSERVYFSFNNLLFGLGENGQVLFKKKLPGRISSLAVNDHYLYFIVESNQRFLYSLDLNLVNSSGATSTILISETRWPAINLGKARGFQGPLLVSSDNHLFFSQKHDNSDCGYCTPRWFRWFWHIFPDGTFQSKLVDYDFETPFLDNNNLIYGYTPVAGKTGLVILDSEGDQVHLQGGYSFAEGFPLVLSEDGTFYAIGAYGPPGSAYPELFWFRP